MDYLAKNNGLYLLLMDYNEFFFKKIDSIGNITDFVV